MMGYYKSGQVCEGSLSSNLTIMLYVQSHADCMSNHGCCKPKGPFLCSAALAPFFCYQSLTVYSSTET